MHSALPDKIVLNFQQFVLRFKINLGQLTAYLGYFSMKASSPIKWTNHASINSLLKIFVFDFTNDESIELPTFKSKYVV